MPRSPRTRVRRTFVGESQSTTQLKARWFSSLPVTRTRSSWSRPMRCWVWAATRSTGAPPSQRTRSRSWVARSLTTPTSRTRSGNGPTRSVATRKTSPSWPPWTRRRSSTSAGLQRSTWPTAPCRPASRTTPMSSRASSALAASGFSTSTWIPSAASSRTVARCSSVGTATTAKSGVGPAARSSASEAWISDASCTAPKRSPEGSTAPARRRRGWDWRMRAWWRPIIPSPSTAPRSGSSFATARLGYPHDGGTALRRPVRRRPLRAGRPTTALAVIALGTATGVLANEVQRVWRRGSAPLPVPDGRVLEAAEEAARQTVEVAVAGYRGGSTRENAALNVLGAFTATFVVARVSTLAIRRRGTFGPFRPLKVQRRHIHHFVPGIVLAFLAGGASVISRDENLDTLLAFPFGAGVALTLDESALLLRLDDVYWSEEGIVSVQITLAAIALLSAGSLARQALRRGASRLPARFAARPPAPPPPAAAGPSSR